MLPFIRPTIPEPDAWLPYLSASYAQRIFSNSGPAALRLEACLTAKYAAPDREAVLVSSCTAGIAAALLATGATGRVVVPAFTFPATAQAVLQSGCRPVFCDVSRDTWETDPASLEQVLVSYPASAVVHVRPFGFCRDAAVIEETAARHGARVIIDAAAALGGRLETGEPVGRQGVIEAFSMHATKVFGIGEGGALFVDPGDAARVRRARNFGIVSGDVAAAGLNAKLSDVHAAIGLAVLDRVEGFIQHRRGIVDRYDRALMSCSWAVRAPRAGIPPMQSYPFLVESPSRAAAVVAGARRKGVELRRYYTPPLHRTTAFGRCERGTIEVSDDLAGRVVCAPVYSDMTDAEADAVIDALLRGGECRD
ncbi:MAG: hypothetical protein DMF86_11500 [Acidobacteria bacterium]|nr:MAG: hypothetical protein DMF86_11500 [Acidobacteriota bacterium]